jgi:hypothetical protein
MVAPAHRRAPVTASPAALHSPLPSSPPLLLFSSGGQGKNPQVAVVDRELQLGIGFKGVAS